MYFDDPITPEILRKINDMKSEIYYNYYKKYGSQIFFVSITMFHYPKKFDIKTQNSNPNQAVYISVLSFARFNQVSINSVAEAKRLLPMIWHTEFIHPMFKFARNNK
jgi:hypothetical protein